MKIKTFCMKFGELILGTALIVGSLYCYKHFRFRASVEKKRGASIAKVMIGQLKAGTVVRSIKVQGEAVANESVVLTAVAQDRVTKINFKDGDSVKKGDILLEQDHALEEDTRKQMEVNLREEERELARLSTLKTNGICSEKEWDTQRTSVLRKKLAMSIVEYNVTDRIIKAPFDGILENRQISLGAMISPGIQIVTLHDVSCLKIDFQVPEKYFPELYKGQKFTVACVSFPGQKFTGSISNVNISLNAITRCVRVRGIIPNTKDNKGSWLLRPGMMFSVTIALDEKQSLTIPEKAVMSLGEIQYIYIYNSNGTVSRREVLLGQRDNGSVEILKGAAAGEKYVLEGVSKLSDGVKVNVVNAGAVGKENAK